MTYANNLDPDEAPQKCGIQIVWHSDYISAKKWVETMKILKETNIWKNYPACKELMVYFFSAIAKNYKKDMNYLASELLKE